MDDAGTRVMQLACRGAMELPNDPFRAVAAVKLSETRASKIRTADRRAARRGLAYDVYLVERFQDGQAE